MPNPANSFIDLRFQMWSTVIIPGPPKILMVDETQSELAKRLFTSLSRSGLLMANNGTDFNCLILIDHQPLQFATSQYLLALTTNHHTHLLKSTPPIAPIIVTPTTLATPRQIGLFYLKFFTELKLHCSDMITGKMAWFAFSKAKELLRRRRYDVQFGIRC